MAQAMIVGRAREIEYYAKNTLHNIEYCTLETRMGHRRGQREGEMGDI